MTAFLYALGGYVAGSIPFAVIVSRILALPDPRTYGSKNIGATNVLRSGSRIAALLTLVGDAGKGWAAVIVARLLGAEDEILAMVGLAAFLGHVFPVWLRFRGGKGVATLIGVVAALLWQAAIVVAIIWILALLLTRYSSVSGMVGAIAAPIAAFLLQRVDLSILFAGLALLVLWKHRANIGRLLKGTEPRVGKSSG